MLSEWTITANTTGVNQSLIETRILSNYFNVAPAALFLYDYFLTLDQEISLVWRRPRSIHNILFVLTRYLPFIDTITFVIYKLSVPFLTVRICRIIYPIQAALCVVGVCSSEAILLNRSAAVWGNNKHILLWLVALLVLGTGVVIFSLTKYGSANLTTTPQTVDSSAMVNYLCPSEVATVWTVPYFALPWILSLTFETILICLILPKAIAQRVFGRTDLYNAIYIKGARFYMCTFGSRPKLHNGIALTLRPATSVANIIAMFYPFRVNEIGIQPLYLFPYVQSHL